MTATLDNAVMAFHKLTKELDARDHAEHSMDQEFVSRFYYLARTHIDPAANRVRTALGTLGHHVEVKKTSNPAQAQHDPAIELRITPNDPRIAGGPKRETLVILIRGDRSNRRVMFEHGINLTHAPTAGGAEIAEASMTQDGIEALIAEALESYGDHEG